MTLRMAQSAVATTAPATTITVSSDNSNNNTAAWESNTPQKAIISITLDKSYDNYFLLSTGYGLLHTILTNQLYVNYFELTIKPMQQTDNLNVENSSVSLPQ